MLFSKVIKGVHNPRNFSVAQVSRTVKVTSFLATMKSFIVFTALIAGIAAKAAVGTDTTNFNTFDVKERDFADTYGAPAAPVESSWVADPAWSNNIAGDATFNGGNNVGVGVGINGNLGYSSGGAVSSGIGGFGMNLLTGVLVILAIAQVVKVSFALTY